MTAPRVFAFATLVLLLTSCTEGGIPNTDTEAIMFGLVFLAAIALAGWFIHCLTRRW